MFMSGKLRHSRPGERIRSSQTFDSTKFLSTKTSTQSLHHQLTNRSLCTRLRLRLPTRNTPTLPAMPGILPTVLIRFALLPIWSSLRAHGPLSYTCTRVWGWRKYLYIYVRFRPCLFRFTRFSFLIVTSGLRSSRTQGRERAAFF